MYTDLKGKTAFVMGAGKARGIGFHIAGALARQGVSVCLADRDGCVFERARELEAEGVVARAFTADVCSAAQVEAMRDAVGRLFPSIDILIQCAGVFPDPVKLTEDSIETWLRTQDINVHGTFRLLHAFLPLMRARGGSVVAVASGAGKRPLPGYSGYSVSKAGLIMLLKSVAVEYARRRDPGQQHLSRPRRERDGGFPGGGGIGTSGRSRRNPARGHPENHSAGPHGQRGRHCEDGAVPGFGRVLVSDGAVPQSVGRHDH